MRLSIWSNAPWARTGYGVQTALFAPRLKQLGHDVAITAFWGLQGGVLSWRGIPVYPRGLLEFGQDIAAAHATNFKADLLISLFDVFVIEPSMLPGVRWCAWVTIDQEPLPHEIKWRLKHSYQPIAYSRYGERVGREAGLDMRYVPLAVDTNVYKPGEKIAARERIGLPKDAYVVGMVAANKGLRKNFTAQFVAFAEFRKKHPDAVLYVHTRDGRHNDVSGLNLYALAEALSIQDSVYFCDNYHYLLGFSDDYMAAVYNAMDCLLSVSHAEGFGIPILEAQSCGTPVIVGDWSAMSELCFAGVAIPTTFAERIWTTLNGWQWQAHASAILEAMEHVYNAGPTQIAYWQETARQRALEYDADAVTVNYWHPLLTELEARIAAEKVPADGATPAEQAREAVTTP